jgi:hypothetical protein
MAATAEKKPAAVKVEPVEVKVAGPRGSWIVRGPDGSPVMAEASKMRAALAALEVKGSIELWEFGVWQEQAVTS